MARASPRTSSGPVVRFPSTTPPTSCAWCAGGTVVDDVGLRRRRDLPRPDRREHEPRSRLVRCGATTTSAATGVKRRATTTWATSGRRAPTTIHASPQSGCGPWIEDWAGGRRSRDGRVPLGRRGGWRWGQGRRRPDPRGGLCSPTPPGPCPRDSRTWACSPTRPIAIRVVDVAFAYLPRWPLWSGGSRKQRAPGPAPGHGHRQRRSAGLALPRGSDPVQVVRRRGRPARDPCAPQADRRHLGVRDVPVERGRRTTPSCSMGTGRSWWSSAAIGSIRSRAPLMCRESAMRAAPTRSSATSSLQLSTASDGGPSPLTRLDQAGLLGAAPPSAPRTVADHVDPSLPTGAEAVLGDFVGNCVHCHNGTDGASSSFDLDPGVALANTIDQSTESSASAVGIRIVPGDPARLGAVRRDVRGVRRPRARADAAGGDRRAGHRSDRAPARVHPLALEGA